MKDLAKIRWLVDLDWGQFGVQVIDGKIFLHCRIHEWSVSKLREAKKVWGQIIEHFKKHGVKRVYSMIPKTDPALTHKFQAKFGLHEVMQDDRFVYYMKEV